MPAQIDHIVVLMLENRSFDHMLGFLKHPKPDEFPGLKGNESNPLFGHPPVRVRKNASEIMAVGPGHHHEDIMYQLTRQQPASNGRYAPPYNCTSKGFAENYQKVYREKTGDASHGAEALSCFGDGKVPVLHMLAREFAVCTQWFCSVPGMTQPNRHFVHAATSDGLVDNKLRPLNRTTVYEMLDSNLPGDVVDDHKSWRTYLGGVSTTMQFPWVSRLRHRKKRRSLKRLLKDIRKGDLPAYSFVDPDHFFWFSNSQHPMQNKKDGADFRAAEKLIADIYNALTANPELFKKTLFVITYDEHGGFYDSAEPPRTIAPDSKTRKFGFDLLGARVPAVLVSPRIARGTIDDTVYDHTSVIASVRERFCPDAAPLTKRDENANTFLHALSLAEPRTNLPTAEHDDIADEDERKTGELNDFHHHLVGTAIELKRRMEHEASSTTEEALNTYDRMHWWGEDHEKVIAELSSPEETEKYVRHVAAAYLDAD